MTTPDDLITVTEARELLHISRSKMAELLKVGAIRQFPNPLDKREKLVSRDEVLALRPKKLEAA